MSGVTQPWGHQLMVPRFGHMHPTPSDLPVPPSPPRPVLGVASVCSQRPLVWRAGVGPRASPPPHPAPALSQGAYPEPAPLHLEPPQGQPSPYLAPAPSATSFPPVTAFVVKILKFYLFIYLFLAARALGCRLSRCRVWASHRGDRFCCGACALGTRASGVVAS